MTYCVDLIGETYVDTNPELIESFRPKIKSSLK